MELSQTQRQFLRKSAHDLKPVVWIGKNGVTDQTYASVEEVFNTQELIKMKFNDYQDEKHELSQQIADQTGASLIGVIGNTAILFRQHRNAELRKVILPR